MKITIYELLGLFKDGKAPKKIKYENCEYYLYDNKSYLTTDKRLFFTRIYFSELNNEVEILEEKKIPEKLSTWFSVENVQNNGLDKTEFIIKYANHNFETYFNKINEIIDFLKSKGE